MAKELGGAGFLVRVLLAAALVFGTYNPTAYSFTSWVFSEGHEFGPETAIVGIILLIAWIVLLRATFLSFGWLGVILWAALCGSIIWWLVDEGWLSLESSGAITWVILVVISLVLAAGTSWSHLRRRLTGQVAVDDVED